jgi:hypothetical protein
MLASDLMLRREIKDAQFRVLCFFRTVPDTGSRRPIASRSDDGTECNSKALLDLSARVPGSGSLEWQPCRGQQMLDRGEQLPDRMSGRSVS